MTAVVARVAPAARPVSVLKPTLMPSPGAGGGATGARKKLTRKASAAAGPVLRAVNDTVSGRATPMAGGAETATISRSGRNGTMGTRGAGRAAVGGPVGP